ncbi:DNA phosphorothioation-associated putative methyltransferase [Paraburkholderia tuberum]|uniref:DNA phosphorothioation-associated putative methyltransferase n=1 Tax=Paraburkholderia tuberum TaxID=157910 RepID=A0A1H1DVH4_9BURK|nr:DNA phosphorothioation-associated putative methyltransferase [Paraburkholderia tuberum]SDQ80340.1 DNA phosphorothioation-associated putative methyltransferase [Paraburkholderia tuberum]
MLEPTGKLVIDELYIHRDALAELDEVYVAVVTDALRRAPQAIRDRANVIKLHRKTLRVSLLTYRDFFDEPFPSLFESLVVDRAEHASPAYRSYAESLNPPILHRKELLLPAGHALRSKFTFITQQAEELGLFDAPSTIGFSLNWRRLIASKGYQLKDGQFLPVGNAEPTDDVLECLPGVIARHLTALSRSNLSAPVQLLLRHGLLSNEWTFFDYGCGRGDDIAALRSSGYSVSGWDPYYAPDNTVTEADAVNLGFVVNVIEDPAERIEALRQAFGVTRKVLSVAVMLNSARAGGQQYRDGFLSSRNTFQKYFSQDELKDYLELALQREAFPVGPGIAFVFADQQIEQRFLADRYRTRGVGARLIALAKTVDRRTRREPNMRPPSPVSQDRRPLLDKLWEITLDLGRKPDRGEVDTADEIVKELGSLNRANRALDCLYDRTQLERATAARTDDLRVFFAMQIFVKRPPYRTLEPRLQRDIKAFFGDYERARSAGMSLLQDAASTDQISAACKYSAEIGLGWLDPEGALIFQKQIVDRLSPVLRVYVGCGLLLYRDASEVQLIKIHALSGKLTLMEFDNFWSALPSMTRRTKINIRRQHYDIFEYSGEYEKPLLYTKSRYLSDEDPCYADQYAFDQALERLALFDPLGYGISAHVLGDELERRRLSIEGFSLVPSKTIPSLDQPCGANFIFRDFIECGATEQRVRVDNTPRRAETYNALHNLAIAVLDPIIDYFGGIRLTYGFCSHILGKHISHGIAPKLDQHAAEEIGPTGAKICGRGGAACDFIVDDEDMQEVALWIMSNLPFDRLYFYGRNRPIHVSYAARPSRLAYEMRTTSEGRRIPRALVPGGIAP